jgi:serine/threonine protein kinase
MSQSIIGKIVDNYQITGILGKGGMGVVYKAKDMTLDRDVALKMMDSNLARDEDFLKRFKSEAKALAKMQSPNIVSVFALRETEIGFALVMEFVEGNTLADRIRLHGPMPLAKALPIFKQLLTALDDAHRTNVIHRDIKPSNVMLTPGDVVKVTDFGLAKIQQVSSATVTMGTGGTLYYMSPEQIRGLSNVDARGDIYSLGMTLYETVTGRVPFGNDLTDFDIRQMIVDGKIPPPDKFNPGLPKDLVKAIMKSIDKDPAKRFQSAAEMWDAISRVPLPAEPAKRSETAEPVIRPAPNLKKHYSPRRPLYITLGIGVALIAGYFGIRPLLSSSSTISEGSAIQPATISVLTEPGGSNVIINGKRLGPAPVNNLSVASGKVSVKVDHEGYSAKDTTVVAKSGEALTLNIALRKAGELDMTDRNPPAVDGRQRPSAALQSYSEGVALQERGNYDGAYEKFAQALQSDPSFGEARTRLEAVKLLLKSPKKKETRRAEGTGEKPKEREAVGLAALVLQAIPGGTITVDGETATNSGNFQVQAGEQTITFENPKYPNERITKRVSVQPGEKKQLTCYFEAYVSIAVSGDASGGLVVVDGKTTDVYAPIARMPLGPGKHKITVTRFQYTTVEGEQEVVVTPSFEERTKRLAFTLKRNVQ